MIDKFLPYSILSQADEGPQLAMLDKDRIIVEPRLSECYNDKRGPNQGTITATLVAILVIAIGSAYYCGYDIRSAKGLLISMGLLNREHDFSQLYRRYEMHPLSFASEQTTEVFENLMRLEQEKCDKQAVYSASTKLVEQLAKRPAIELLLGFSKSCFDVEGEIRMATDYLIELNDFSEAVRQSHRLVGIRPEVPDYSYRLAKSEAGLGKIDQALQDYATAIKLHTDPQQIGEWVFFEMSQMYASKRRYCEAITPIQTYVSIKPSERDTSATRQMMDDYSARGQCTNYAHGGDSFTVLSNDVIPVRVIVNGVAGTFALDTGASFVAVTENFARRAGLKDVRRSIVTTQTANGLSEGQLVSASSISVGRAAAESVPVMIQKQPFGSIDGLLGRSFLSRFDLSISGSSWTLSAKKTASSAVTLSASSDIVNSPGQSQPSNINSDRIGDSPGAFASRPNTGRAAMSESVVRQALASERKYEFIVDETNLRINELFRLSPKKDNWFYGGVGEVSANKVLELVHFEDTEKVQGVQVRLELQLFAARPILVTLRYLLVKDASRWKIVDVGRVDGATMKWLSDQKSLSPSDTRRTSLPNALESLDANLRAEAKSDIWRMGDMRSADVAVSAPSSTTDQPGASSQKEISAAMQVWEVQAMRYGTATVCEAHMRGRNVEGGGDYTVRMLVNGDTPTFVIEHEGGRFPGSPEAVFTINNEFKVMTRPIQQDSWGGHDAFLITLNFENFTQKFIPNLENQVSHTFEIHVGPRKYLMVAQGFKDISAAMGQCNSNLVSSQASQKDQTEKSSSSTAPEASIRIPVAVKTVLAAIEAENKGKWDMSLFSASFNKDIDEADKMDGPGSDFTLTGLYTGPITVTSWKMIGDKVLISLTAKLNEADGTVSKVETFFMTSDGFIDDVDTNTEGPQRAGDAAPSQMPTLRRRFKEIIAGR